MNNTWIASVLQSYDWLSALIALAGIIFLFKTGKYLAFKVPSLQRMRELNTEEDAKRMAQAKYPPLVKAGNRVGFLSNVAFFSAVLPFCITAQPQSIATVLGHTLVVLMVYDFFYYLAHRFWFHSNGFMRKIHAVHHQARNPSYIDASYVHPAEVLVGMWLYILTVLILALFIGPFHIVTMVLTYLIFMVMNTINHTRVELPYFPFKTLTWVVAKHHVHHENMHKGNYATITLLFDKMFGTLD